MLKVNLLRTRFTWLYLFLIFYLFFVFIGISKTLEATTNDVGTQASPKSEESSPSTTEEAESSVESSNESSPEISVTFLNSKDQVPPPPSNMGAISAARESDEHKIKMPKAPKFGGDEEVSEGAVLTSPFDKQTSTDDLDFVRFEKVPGDQFIYQMPVTPEKIKLRDIKPLEYKVEPEISVDEYQIGKDISKDSELYYSLKEKVANEKKVLSEVSKVVIDAEEYLKSIDSSIRSLVLAVNQVKETILQNEEQLANMQKTGTTTNVSIVAQEDEIARLKLRYQEIYGKLMSEKRKRQSAIDLSLKAKQQELDIKERIKRTEDKISLLEDQLAIHDEPSIPSEPLELLKETEPEIKQQYVPDEYSLVPRRSDVDMSPASYDVSAGLEVEESAGPSEESVEPEIKEETPVKPIKPSEEAPLSISEMTTSISGTDFSKELPEHPATEVTSKPTAQFNQFDLTKYFQESLPDCGSDSDLMKSKKSNLSKRVNVVNFAMSCIYEVDFYLKQLNFHCNSNFNSSEALKICRKVWRDSFNHMVRFYGTFAPSTIRAIFKTSIQNDQEAVSSLTNYYVEDQFEAIAKHVDINSPSSCKHVVGQLFKSGDFQESLIESICKNLVYYYNSYDNLISDKNQLMLLAAKIAVYASAPYSFDSAPYSNSNDLDQMIMEFDFKSLTSSANFYAQCLKVFGFNYGPSSIYGLSNNSVQSVCTNAQSIFTKALPHGVEIVIFSTKQFAAELVPLLKGSDNVSFYGVSMDQGEVLLPKDVSASSNSLHPVSVSELSPALQISLQTLDEQAKTQKFLQEQQESIKKILQNPLSTGDMHKVVEVLSELNEKQRAVERSILSVSPLPEIQSVIVSIPGGSINSLSKSADPQLDISNEFTVLGVFMQGLSNQNVVLDSQISQLETILKSPTLSNEDRSITQSLLKDTEKRKSNLNSYYDEAANSLSVSSVIPEISGMSLSPSVIPGSEKARFDKSIHDLKLLFADLSESNKECLKLLDSVSSSSVSDSSLKNELESVRRKTKKVSSKLQKISKKLQQPNISFKTEDEIEEFKKLLARLIDSSKSYSNRLRAIERSNSQGTEGLNSGISHSLSPMLSQSVLSQVPLPSVTSKISSLIVKIQHIQSQIQKFLAQLKMRKLHKNERKNLKKLFADIDPKIVILYKLIIKLNSTHNLSQVNNFSQRYSEEIIEIFNRQKKFLRDYLLLSNRGDSSPDGIKINGMVNDLSSKQSNIEKILASGLKKSAVSKEVSQIEQSASPVIEPELLSKTPPGYKPKKLELPALPLFVKPYSRPKIKYGKIRKDSRGVPIVSGPNAGTNVAEKALDYIEKALDRQKTVGVYPENYRVSAGTPKKSAKLKLQIDPSVTKSAAKDMFCTKHGYSSMSVRGNNIAYRLYTKSPKILPKSAVTTIDKKTACDIASLLKDVKIGKECAKTLYPTLSRLGFSVSLNRTEKICGAIGIDGKAEGCSSLISYRTSKPYNFATLEEERAAALFSQLSKLQSVGTLSASSNVSQHLVCHVIESMKASLVSGESFSSFLAFECSLAFEQQASHDGNPFTSTQLAAILKACEAAGFPTSS